MKYIEEQTLEPRDQQVLDRVQLKKIIGHNIADVNAGGLAKRCYYSCTFTLNGGYQTVHSWGATCDADSDCSTNTTCSSYGEPWILTVKCI